MSTQPVIEPAIVEFGPDGMPFSVRYHDVYRSREGALAESNEVFVQGAHLQERWRGRSDYTVLEVGFGLGLNFLATVRALLDDPAGPECLHFVSVEAHPLDRADLSRAHEALGLAKDLLSRELLQAWPLAMPGLHRLTFSGGRVRLILAYGFAEPMLPQLQLRADSVYLDGFAPSRNPDAWTPWVMRRIARHCARGATLASYSVSGAVREALSQAGFETIKVKGFATKRERLEGQYSPRWRTWPEPPSPAYSGDRHAVVIGAGLAGCTTTRSLIDSGWRVTLIDEAGELASGGSGQPLVADHLHLSPDDNRMARLTRAALSLRRTASTLMQPIGRLTVVRDAAEESTLQSMMSRLRFPAAFAQPVDAEQASDIAGIRLMRGGLWMPDCCVVQPLSFCQSLLPTRQSGLTLVLNTRVLSLIRTDAGWQVRTSQGASPLEASIVIVCTGTTDHVGISLASLSMRRTRGQSTWLNDSSLSGLRTIIGGTAYAVPGEGRVLIGSTYDDRDQSTPDPRCDASNVERFARTLGYSPSEWHPPCEPASVGFRWNTADRLPLIGPLPDEAAALSRRSDLARNERLALPYHEGLFTLSGLGSRGLLWSALGAEYLAATINGWPLPLERDLAESISPARNLRPWLRRSRVAR